MILGVDYFTIKLYIQRAFAANNPQVPSAILQKRPRRAI